MIASGTENERYVRMIPGYDEAVASDGRLLRGWDQFLQGVADTPPDIRRTWRDTIRRDLKEDGLTFTVRQDDAPAQRLEDLDPVPWILPPHQWNELETGLRQRARLLEEVVRDLTGPKRLIRKRLLPAELIFTDPAYLRPAVDLPANMGACLFQYAADMARGPDGRMWVLEDRTQAPSGAGYALESRTILGRIFPQWISQLNVRRLAPYFRQFRDSMMQMYEGRRLEPRVVLMTPGPYSSTYFEHAYLAAYLGYTLVQGDDLVVRDGALKLKTLEGLQPVDILLRRVDADFMDPLELRRDSFLGVPGLLGAMRAKRVASINHPGCGLLENRGLLPFLPVLCKELLGEELLLPSAATWWCGQERERGYVLDHLEELVIKPIQHNTAERSVYGWQCSKSELEVLRQRILSHPEGYVGQQRIGFSTVPMLVGGGLEPRASVLRVFAAASPDGYQVMPGALARCAPQAGSQRVSMRSGGVIKDVWVLGEAPEEHRSIWIQNREERNSDWFTGVFTSRSAENLFWVGRYAERLTRQARLLRGMIQLEDVKLDLEQDPPPELLGMVSQLESLCDWPKEEEGTEPRSLLERLRMLVQSEDLPGGLQWNLRSLMVAAYAVRDIWSQDSWRTLTSIESLGISCRAEEVHPFSLEKELDGLLEGLYAFYGLNACGMTRESGWNMLMLGRALESGIGLCDLIHTMLLPEEGSGPDYNLMEIALRQNENLITYRRHYRTTPDLLAVLDLMLTLEINPRSLAFHLRQAAEQLHQLPPPTIPSGLDASLIHLKQVRNPLLEKTWQSEEDLFPAVRKVLDDVRQAMEQASNAVSSAYFHHVPVRTLEKY